MRNDTCYFGEMLEAAKALCRLVEGTAPCNDARSLADMTRILFRIHTAMAFLDAPEHDCYDDMEFALPDLDEKFEVYCRLKDRLGSCDAYRMEDDEGIDTDSMTGSLAGDFTDIYFELRYGLTVLEAAPNNRARVQRIWRSGYVMQWGQRLVDAQKHLFALRQGPCGRGGLSN